MSKYKSVIIFLIIYATCLLYAMYAGHKDDAPWWFYLFVLYGISFIFYCIAGMIQSVDDIGK